ncbi:MAG: MarR family winged helix-turn-helix transcriptional regulator [Flavobacteriales bacterium]
MKKTNNTEKNSSFSNPEDHTSYLLWQVNMAWQRKIKSILDPFDLTHAQYMLLASLHWLSTQKKYVQQQDLANHIAIDKMMTSKILRLMQKKGYIKRTKNKIDTRARNLMITEKGEEILLKANKSMNKIEAELLAPLGLAGATLGSDLYNLYKSKIN